MLGRVASQVCVSERSKAVGRGRRLPLFLLLPHFIFFFLGNRGGVLAEVAQ